jgi:hypothetical protein
MADINWGILQPAGAGDIKTAQPQAQGAPAPPSPSPTANMNLDQASNMMHEQQQMGLLKQENERANQLQPGLLQQQADVHAKAQSEQAMMQYQVQQRQGLQQAYAKGASEGGSEAGFDAVQEEYAKQGNPEAALTLAKTREDLQQLKTSGDTKGLASIGNIVYGIQKAEVPPTPDQKDPKTGQIIPGNPGKTGLQVYQEQYATVKKLYPNAPDPAKFKSDQEFEDSFVHPVLDTSLGALQQEKAKQAELDKNKLYQNQQMVKQSVGELQSAIKTHGADSQEARNAAKALAEAQNATKREAIGNGLGAGLVSHLPESVGGLADTDDLMEQNMPTGKSAGPVQMPAFESKMEFQNWFANQSPAQQAAVKAQLGK